MSTDPDQNANRATYRKGRDLHRGGFSLLEVVLALTILSIIGGTIFAIVSGSTRAAVDIEQIQKENRRLRTFYRLCRETFATLPGGASLELRIVERYPFRQELVIRGDHEAFLFGDLPRHEHGEITLSARRREDVTLEKPVEAAPSGRTAADALPGSDSDLDEETFVLAMSTPNFYIPPQGNVPNTIARSPIKSEKGNQFIRPDEKERFWLELLPDVREVRWKFWDQAKKKWMEEHTPVRPPLIELTLISKGGKTPVRVVFDTR